MQELMVLCLILIVTMMVSALFQRINLPTVVGQLLVGILLGPAILNWIHPGNLINNFANLGVVILMFIAGLESDIKLLKKYLRPGLIVAILGVILPMIVFTITGHFIHLNIIDSIFLGVIFSATSVSISVEVLKELNQLSSREGITILSAAVIDDILGVILLSIVTTLAGTSQSGIQSYGLLMTFLIQILYFIGVWLVIKWVVPFILKLGHHLNIEYALMLTAMIIVFGMAGIADDIGLSAVTGSFFAGLAIGQTKYVKNIDQPIKTLGYSIFIPVFFTSIGLEMTISGIYNHLILFLMLTILAILTKIVGSSLGGYFTGFNLKHSMIIGSGMVSRGEVALIVAQIGYTSRLISGDLYSTVIGTIIVTTILAPFLLKYFVNNNNL